MFWHLFVSKFVKRSSILTHICDQICQKIKYFDTNFKVHSSSIWTPTKFAKRSSILTPICHQNCQTIDYFDTNFSDSEEWYLKKAVFCGPKFKREGIFHKEIVPTGVGATQKMQQSFWGIWAKIQLHEHVCTLVDFAANICTLVDLEAKILWLVLQ